MTSASFIKLSSIFTFLQTTTWIFSASNDENMLPVCPDSFPVWDVFAAACVRPPANQSSALCARTPLCSPNWIKSTSAAVTFGCSSALTRRTKAHFLVLRSVFLNAPSTDARPNMAKGSSRDTSLTPHTVGNIAPVIRRAIRWRVRLR